jgi:hypothetical protein
MKALVLFASLAILAIGMAGCTVVAEHPHPHRVYVGPDEVIVVGPPPPPNYYYYPPPERYYVVPERHWRR